MRAVAKKCRDHSVTLEVENASEVDAQGAHNLVLAEVLHSGSVITVDALLQYVSVYSFALYTGHWEEAAASYALGNILDPVVRSNASRALSVNVAMYSDGSAIQA